MECILGAEFTVVEPKPYHITAYNFDPEYPQLKKYFEDMASRQTDNTLKCFEEAVALGNIKEITWDEVLEYNKSIKWICNNHVFEAMKAKGLVKESDYYNWFKLNYEKQRGKYPPSIDFMPLKELADMIKRAYKSGIEKNLFISGGSDHEGLCGGYYSSFSTEEELKNSPFYIEPLSMGTTEHFFNEIKNGKILR